MNAGPARQSSDPLRARLLEHYRETLRPLTDALLAAARIEPGSRVIEIGSGNGDVARLAAGRAGRHGFVLASDPSRAALAGLAERLDIDRLPCRIELLAAPAEDLDLEPASFDAVLSRNSLMYCRDPKLALGKLRSCLRRGGRIAASVYDAVECDPFHAIPIAAVRRRRAIAPPFPAYVQAFRVGVEETTRWLRDAGFVEVEHRRVTAERRYASLNDALELLRASPSLDELMTVLPEAQREDAWRDIADGFRAFESAAGLILPATQWIVAGTA